MESSNCLLVTDVVGDLCDDDIHIYLECNYDPDLGVFCEGELLFTNDELLQFHEENEKFYEEHENCACTEMHPYDKFLYNSPGGVKWYTFHCVSDLGDDFTADLTERGHKVLIKEGGFTLRKDGKEHIYSGYHIVEIGIRKIIRIKKAK